MATYSVLRGPLWPTSCLVYKVLYFTPNSIIHFSLLLRTPLVDTLGDREKVGTYEPLYSSLIPFDHCTLNSIGLEKSENARRSIICTLSSGSSGMSRDPNHNGTDSILPILVGDKTSCFDGRIPNLSRFQELADLGSNGIPDGVEWCVKDSIDSLGNGMWVSALWDGEGIFEEVRVVEELRRVRRDTAVVGGPFPVRESIWCRIGSIQGSGGGREVGRRPIRGWRGG